MKVLHRLVCVSVLLVGAEGAYAQSDNERLVDEYSKCAATFGLLSKAIEDLATKVAEGDPAKIEGGKYGAENFMQLAVFNFQKAYELAPKDDVVKIVEKYSGEYGAQRQKDPKGFMTFLLDHADKCKPPEEFK